MAEPNAPSPLAPPAPTGTAVPLVDITVNSALFTKRRLAVSEQMLWWGEERVPLDSVEAVAYCVTRTSINGIPSGTNYTFLLWSQGRQTKVILSTATARSKADREAYANAFTVLANVSARLVEPRLRRRLVEAVAAGVTVKVAGVGISGSGITRPGRLFGTRSLAWDHFAGAGFSQGTVVVNAHKDGGRKQVFAVPMTEANAVLLPELLEQCAELSVNTGLADR